MDATMVKAPETGTWADAMETITSVLRDEFGDRPLDVLLNGPMVHFAAKDDRQHVVTISKAGIRGARPDGSGDYEFWCR